MFGVPDAAQFRLDRPFSLPHCQLTSCCHMVLLITHRCPPVPRQDLSDNAPSYVANDLSDWLEGQGMKHTRGKPYHPMTRERSSAGTSR
jgi:transposase InsO family protein